MKRLSLLLALLIACAHAPSVDRSTGAAAVREADLAFSKATRARGIQGFAEFIAEDFNSVGQDGLASGRTEYLSEWSKLLARPGATVNWHPVLSGADDDMGWTAGTYEFTAPSVGGTPETHTGRYVSVWHRQPDGRWKVVFDMGTPNPH